MKKLIALMLALVMSLSLVACGGGDDTGASTDTNTPAVETTGADIQPAIDAFNAASGAFDAVANEVNANIDIYSQELIDTMIAMSDSMTETKTLLESNPELTEEKVQELVATLNDVEAWSKEVQANLDTFVEVVTIDREAVIDAFNYVSPRFDAISIAVNENIDQYEEDFVDGMIEVATGMIGYKELLESGAELDEETCIAILEDLQMIDEWVTAVEEAEG